MAGERKAKALSAEAADRAVAAGDGETFHRPVKDT